MILAIDPGTANCGWSILDREFFPFTHGISTPGNMIELMPKIALCLETVIVERPVCTQFSGRDVSETAILAGRLIAQTDLPSYLITRSKVKGRLIGKASSKKSTDSQIINYLADRFCPGEPNYGKGTKKRPGFFYGFKGDIWQAYAIGVAYLDMIAGAERAQIKYLEENKIQ